MTRVNSLALAVAVASSASSAAAQDPVEGALLYVDYCAVCHGVSLQGDGPMAPALTIPPADLTRLNVDGVFPIFDVVRQIDGRDPLLAHGGDMPIFGRWFQGDGPEVAMATPSGQPILMRRSIADLTAFLMEVQQ